MKLRNIKRAQVRLDSRIKAYEEMCRRSATGGKEYKKPGSLKKG